MVESPFGFKINFVVISSVFYPQKSLVEKDETSRETIVLE